MDKKQLELMLLKESSLDKLTLNKTLHKTSIIHNRIKQELHVLSLTGTSQQP